MDPKITPILSILFILLVIGNTKKKCGSAEDLFQHTSSYFKGVAQHLSDENGETPNNLNHPYLLDGTLNDVFVDIHITNDMKIVDSSKDTCKYIPNHYVKVGVDKYFDSIEANEWGWGSNTLRIELYYFDNLFGRNLNSSLQCNFVSNDQCTKNCGAVRSVHDALVESIKSESETIIEFWQKSVEIDSFNVITGGYRKMEVCFTDSYNIREEMTHNCDGKSSYMASYIKLIYKGITMALIHSDGGIEVNEYYNIAHYNTKVYVGPIGIDSGFVFHDIKRIIINHDDDFFSLLIVFIDDIIVSLDVDVSLFEPNSRGLKFVIKTMNKQVFTEDFITFAYVNHPNHDKCPNDIDSIYSLSDASYYSVGNERDTNFKFKPSKDFCMCKKCSDNGKCNPFCSCIVLLFDTTSLESYTIHFIWLIIVGTLLSLFYIPVFIMYVMIKLYAYYNNKNVNDLDLKRISNKKFIINLLSTFKCNILSMKFLKYLREMKFHMNQCTFGLLFQVIFYALKTWVIQVLSTLFNTFFNLLEITLLNQLNKQVYFNYFITILLCNIMSFVIFSTIEYFLKGFHKCIFPKQQKKFPIQICSKVSLTFCGAFMLSILFVMKMIYLGVYITVYFRDETQATTNFLRTLNVLEIAIQAFRDICSGSICKCLKEEFFIHFLRENEEIRKRKSLQMKQRQRRSIEEPFLKDVDINSMLVLEEDEDV